MHLPENDPELFALFLNWCMAKDMKSCEHYASLADNNGLDQLEQLIGLYITGDNLEAEDFRNFVMDQLCANAKNRYLEKRVRGMPDT